MTAQRKLLSCGILCVTWLVVASRVFADVSHCAKATATIGTVSHRNIETDQLEISTQIATSLELRESACFQIYFDRERSNESNETREKLWGLNGTLLYSFTFESLDLHYPTRDHYKFTIPRIRTDCVCDCPDGEEHCGGSQRYRICDGADLCYVTYHPYQNSASCPEKDDTADVCCKVSLSKDPRHPIYNSFLLEAPSAYASINHRLYVKDQRSMEPKLLHEATLSVPFSRGQVINVAKHELNSFISGVQPSESLSERQYFARNVPHAPLLLDPVINRKGEHDLHKLGWYRVSGNTTKPDIRHGPIKLQSAHHVITEDCVGQVFQNKFDAEYYSTDRNQLNHSLGIIVDRLYPHLLKTSVDIPARTVVVAHRTSEPILLTVRIKGTPEVIVNHHESFVNNFEAVIMLDKYSNRYLNVTFQKARGSLVGIIHTDATRAHVDGVVTSYIEESYPVSLQRIISLPHNVNGSRFICFHTPQQEVCKWVRYRSQPLAWFTVPAPWVETKGTCVDCNKMTASNFLKYLNPRHWFDGISGTPEAVAMGVEIGFYLILAVIGIALCRRLLCPLVRWGLCGCDKNRKS